MIEKEITISSHGDTLSGTVCLPDSKGPYPLVLMIHGSGPLDRDENMKGQPLNIFNTIAHALAAHGFASLRYDKRGCGQSQGDYYRAGHTDLVNDAVNWFDALAQHDFCDPHRIIILGHSEGCIIAPQVSARCTAVAGLILLCPFITDMETILINQARQIEAEFIGSPGLRGQLKRQLAHLMGMSVANQQQLIHKVRTSDQDVIRIRLNRLPARWFRELLHLNPRAIFAKVTCPLLLIGGEKDLQCDPADVTQIAELVRGEVSAHVIPNLTHILRTTEEQPSILGSATLIDQPIEPIVLQLIGIWLTDHFSTQEIGDTHGSIVPN